MSIHIKAATIKVSNPKELKAAVADAKPGDTILLQNKEWKDVLLKVSGKGTAQKPILIMPENKNEVIITGQSALNIGGEYLIIKGFHFKNGYSPKDDIITFRINNDNLANNCRVTECVIEEFSQPDRFHSDSWVVFWGKNNRLDHTTLVNKLNAGPTIIAELNDERSQENFHSIDHNYFKGRQRFGSNGGETIRIGVSRYSLTTSKTQIVHNYFERCNGEVEIVSIKSGQNNVSFNTFVECEGGLVMRHGSKNVVEGNLFLGNNKPFTGGVRLINPGHHIFNNVFKDLQGTAFRSALSVLNGVPNSLINRYYQVKDATINNNTFINCASVLFGAGKDAERTLSPQNVVFANNLFIGGSDKIYQDDNKDGGVIFKDNGILNNKANNLPQGLSPAKVSEIKKGEFSFPYNKSIGADIKKLSFVTKEETGASWYKPQTIKPKRANKSFEIKSTESENIKATLEKMIAGDTLLIADEGYLRINESLVIDKPINIMAKAGLKTKPIFVNTSFKTLNAFIIIKNGGELNLKGLAFKGAFESFGDTKAGIASTEEPMNKHYKVNIDHCEFYDYNEGSYSGFKGSKSTLADSLIITNSLFRNISGTGVNLGEEKDDKGIYAAEYTVIENCVFSNVLGSAINIYRGGNDESTLGPFVTIDHCTFNEVENREQGTVVKLIGAQHASLTNSIFSYCGQGGRSIEFREYRWDEIKVDYCNFYEAGRVDSFYDKVLGTHNYHIKPAYQNKSQFNFNLQKDSELINKGSDNQSIGANIQNGN
ncbi:Alginate lyase precursor [Arcticibacter svalbardensis MN12-7]|uniref:Alginate lyase n=1 Tax=Arcticibacter svalbardensis MN12-7 TaxID=1150600 RepID=R9GTK9_9SPHI|nr:Alginate lyase precursor [Arcticibacter svalbardensis MN12-7]